MTVRPEISDHLSMTNTKRPAAPKRGRPPKSAIEKASGKWNIKTTQADDAVLAELVAIVERKTGREVNVSALIRGLVVAELARQRA